MLIFLNVLADSSVLMVLIETLWNVKISANQLLCTSLKY